MKPNGTQNGVNMASTILVTGGAGYVGSHTVITLLEGQSANFEIVVVDNLTNATKVQGEKKPESLKIIEELTGKTIHFYNVDLGDAVGLNQIFENHNIECVIHFAALKAVGESVEKPLEYYQGNITGTCTLFEVMRKYGVYNLVYSSSCTVYGEPERLPIDEGHPTGRGLTSPYGKSKYFCEEIMKDLCISDQVEKNDSLCRMCMDAISSSDGTELPPRNVGHMQVCPSCGKSLYRVANHCKKNLYKQKDLHGETVEVLLEKIGPAFIHMKWRVISLRYFNPVGAHRSGRIGEDPAGIPNNLMPYISQVAVGSLKELMVFGSDYPTIDGTGVRDYIHVEDLAVGHVKAIKLFQQPGFSGFHAVNLGTGTGYSVLQMVKAFETASGRSIPYRIVGRRAGDIASNYADVGLANRLLGWRATRTLEDMCVDTWRWQSSNPQGYKKN